MKIIIDTNRIVAALFKGSTTRNLLYNKKFEFFTPDYSLTEIEKHKFWIKEKAPFNDNQFELLCSLIFERISIIPFSEYGSFLEEAKNQLLDKDDAPYLALCLSLGAGRIWSHDADFLKQTKVKVFTNIDLINYSKQDH